MKKSRPPRLKRVMGCEDEPIEKLPSIRFISVLMGISGRQPYVKVFRYRKFSSTSRCEASELHRALGMALVVTLRWFPCGKDPPWVTQAKFNRPFPVHLMASVELLVALRSTPKFTELLTLSTFPLKLRVTLSQGVGK